jgi:hypothetical protein
MNDFNRVMSDFNRGTHRIKSSDALDIRNQDRDVPLNGGYGDLYPGWTPKVAYAAFQTIVDRRTKIDQVQSSATSTKNEAERITAIDYVAALGSDISRARVDLE